MYDLDTAFPGPRETHDAHVAALACFADGAGHVPEPGDSPAEFGHAQAAAVAEWESFVKSAMNVTEHHLVLWRNEQMGPPRVAGFMTTATRDCGLGCHESCPGWNKSGRFTLLLTTLGGAQYHDAVSWCACRTCGHGEQSAVASGG